MPNDEQRVTNSNDVARPLDARVALVVRHSSFIVRHSSFVARVVGAAEFFESAASQNPAR
jgi:hypothetical protein